MCACPHLSRFTKKGERERATRKNPRHADAVALKLTTAPWEEPFKKTTKYEYSTLAATANVRPPNPPTYAQPRRLHSPDDTENKQHHQPPPPTKHLSRRPSFVNAGNFTESIKKSANCSDHADAGRQNNDTKPTASTDEGRGCHGDENKSRQKPVGWLPPRRRRRRHPIPPSPRPNHARMHAPKHQHKRRKQTPAKKR